MSAAKKYAKRYCKAQVGCDGVAVNLGYDSCYRCREILKQRSKPPPPLRGEHVLRYQESRYK